jgi:hyperosmotically inducible protein
MRFLLRLILVVVILAAAGTFLLGWWGTGLHRPSESSVGTSGHVDAARAREIGAKAGEDAAAAAQKTEAILSDAGLTAKIKSKMALDDSVRARSIDVTTKDHVVSLSGTVRSSAEHDRAVQLTRETNGVTRVIDDLKIQR